MYDSAAARSIACNHRIVLPIPASAASTNAAGAGPPSRNSPIVASSSSQPAQAAAQEMYPILSAPPATDEGAPELELLDQIGVGIGRRATLLNLPASTIASLDIAIAKTFG